MKNKIKTTSFWLGVGSSIVIALSCLSELFGFEVCTDVVDNIVVCVCSVLVMLGIITKRSDQDVESVTKDDLIAEIENFKNGHKD